MSRWNQKWLKARKDAWFEGKTCGMCGSTERLEIDHYDPEEKSFTIHWGISWKKLQAELEKCWVLCHDCHLEKTLSERPAAQHGTTGMYNNHGCKCSECKAANAARSREYNKRRFLK